MPSRKFIAETQTTEPKPYRCRCGYEWFPRRPGDHPRVCPKCKSPNWDKPYKFRKTSGRYGQPDMVRDIGLQKQMYMNTASILFEEASAANNKTLSIHRWVNWIAGFSGDFAQGVIQQYLPFPEKGTLILDPFAGVGTTLVEAYRKGINCVGFEINPFAALVSKVKLQAPEVDVLNLKNVIYDYRVYMQNLVLGGNTSQLTPRSVVPPGFHSRIPFFSTTIETQVLFTLDFIQDLPSSFKEIFRVALGSVLVGFSNYTYEPSLGSRPAAGKSLIDSAPVGEIISKKLENMTEDIALLQHEINSRSHQPTRKIYSSSYFDSDNFIEPNSVDLVVTSPPYMNNYHYIRNTRPQLYWAALANSSNDLKFIEESNFGKYWQTVRGRKKILLDFVLSDLEQQILEIREKNCNKGVYGGAGWANYVSGYMNDLYRFIGLLGRQLRPKTGIAVIVLGNSVIQGIHVPVEKYTAQIAKTLDLKVEGINVLRSRVGSSIVNTGARLAGDKKYGLYDFAIVLRRK
jgi:hypothetical protein